MNILQHTTRNTDLSSIGIDNGFLVSEEEEVHISWDFLILFQQLSMTPHRSSTATHKKEYNRV